MSSRSPRAPHSRPARGLADAGGAVGALRPAPPLGAVREVTGELLVAATEHPLTDAALVLMDRKADHVRRGFEGGPRGFPSVTSND